MWVLWELSVLSSQFFCKSKAIFLSNHKLQHKLHKRNNLPDVTFSASAPGFQKEDSGSFFALVSVCGTSRDIEPFVATVTKPHLPISKSETNLSSEGYLWWLPPSEIDSCYLPLSFKLKLYVNWGSYILSSLPYPYRLVIFPFQIDCRIHPAAFFLWGWELFRWIWLTWAREEKCPRPKRDKVLISLPPPPAKYKTTGRDG